MSENQAGASTPKEESAATKVNYWDKLFYDTLNTVEDENERVESMGLPRADHVDVAIKVDAPQSEEPDNPPEQSFTPLTQEQVQPDRAGENTGAERSEQTEEEIMASLQDEYESLSRLITLIDTTQTSADQALVRLQETQIQQDLAQLGIDIPQQQNGKDRIQVLNKQVQNYIETYLGQLFRLGRGGVEFYKQQTDADQRAHSLSSFDFLSRQKQSIAKHIGHKRNINKMPKAFQRAQNLELLRQYGFELTYGPVQTEEGKQTGEVHIAGLPNPAQFMNHVEQAVRRTRERRAVHAPEPVPGWGAGSEIVPLNELDIEQIKAVLQAEVGKQLDRDLMQIPPRLKQEEARRRAGELYDSCVQSRVDVHVQPDTPNRQQRIRSLRNQLTSLLTGYLQFAEQRKRRFENAKDVQTQWHIEDFEDSDVNIELEWFMNSKQPDLDRLVASYEIEEMPPVHEESDHEDADQKAQDEQPSEEKPVQERSMTRVYPDDYIITIQQYIDLYKEEFGDGAEKAPVVKELHRRLAIAKQRKDVLDRQSRNEGLGGESIGEAKAVTQETIQEADPVVKQILKELGFTYRTRIGEVKDRQSLQSTDSEDGEPKVTRKERILVARLKKDSDPAARNFLLEVWKERIKQDCGLDVSFFHEIKRIITEQLESPDANPTSVVTEPSGYERIRRVTKRLGMQTYIETDDSDDDDDGNKRKKTLGLRGINPNYPSPLIDALKRQWMKKSIKQQSRRGEQKEERRTQREGQKPRERIDAAYTYLHLADTYNSILNTQAGQEEQPDAGTSTSDPAESQAHAFDQETTTQLRNLWQEAITPYNLTTEEQAELRDSLYVLVAEPIESGEQMSLAVSENVARALEGLRFHIKREEATAGEDGTGTTPSQILIEGGKKRFTPSEDPYMNVDSFLNAQAGIAQSSTVEELKAVLTHAGISRIDFVDGVPFEEQQNQARNAIDREINRTEAVGQSRVAMTDILRVIIKHAQDKEERRLQVKL